MERRAKAVGLAVAVVLELALAGGVVASRATPQGHAKQAVGVAEPRPTPTPVVTPTPAPPSVPAAVPTPTPTPVAPPTPVREMIVIHGVGDTNVDPSYIPALVERGYGWALEGLGGLFASDSLSVINLECSASDLGVPEDKQFTFQCDPAALPVLRQAGVDVANLANNHGQDFGVEAMLDSRANVTAAAIAPVGVGMNRDEAYAPALFDVGGWRVAVIGMGGVVPEPRWLAGPESPGMSDGDDIPLMVEAVRRADELADLVFVTIHWGAELELGPGPEDTARAHAMIDAGADGIFGHHAHRLQPLGWYRGRPIAWGLGNFVWPRFSDAGATTAVAQFIVNPDGSMGACLLPAFIVSDGHPVLTEPIGPPCAAAGPPPES